MIINTSKKDKQRLMSSNAAHTADPIISTSTTKTPKSTTSTIQYNGVVMHFIGLLSALPVNSYSNGLQCQIGDVVRLTNSKFYIYMLADNGKSYSWRPMDESLDILLGQLKNDVYTKDQLSTAAQIRIALEKYALASDVSSSLELSQQFEKYYVSSNTSSSTELKDKFSTIDSSLEELQNAGYATSSEVSTIVENYGFTTSQDLEDFKKFITDTIKTNNEQWTDINSIQIIANNNAKEIIKINTKLDSIDLSKYALSSDVSAAIKQITDNNFATNDEVDAKLADYAKLDDLSQTSSQITAATQTAITDATTRIANLEKASNTYGITLANHTNQISDIKKYAEGVSNAVPATIEGYGYSTKDELTSAIDGIQKSLNNIAGTHATKEQLELSVHNLKKQLNNLDYCKLSDFAEVSSKFYTTEQTSSKYEINDAINDVYQYAADAYLLKSKAYETFAKKNDVSTAQELAKKFSSIDEKTTSAQVCALIDERGYANKNDVDKALIELQAQLKFDYVDIPTFKEVSADLNQRQTILECAVRHHHERLDALEKVVPTLATKTELKTVEDQLSDYAKVSSVYDKSETSSAQEIANAVQELKSIAFDPNILSNYFTKNQISAWYERIQRNDDRIDELYEHDYHLQKGIDKNHEDIDELRELIKSIPEITGVIDVSDLRKIVKTISSNYTTSAQVSDIVSAMLSGYKPSEFDPSVLSAYALSNDVSSQIFEVSTELTDTISKCALSNDVSAEIYQTSSEIIDLISRTSCTCEMSNYFDLRTNVSNDVSGSQYISFSQLYDKEPTCLSNKIFLDNELVLNLFRNVKRILFYISAEEDFDLDNSSVEDLFNTVDEILSTEPSLSSYEYDPEVASVDDTANAINYIISNYSEKNISLAQKLRILDKELNLVYWELENLKNNFDNYYTKSDVDEKINDVKLEIPSLENYYTKYEVDQKIDNISVDGSALSNNYVPTSVYNVQINNLTQELAETKQELQQTTTKLHQVVFTMVAHLSSNDNMVLVGDMRSAIVSAMIELSAFL